MIRHLFIALALLGAGQSAHADLLFSQSTTTDQSQVGRGFYSHAAPRANHSAKHGDDFRLAADAAVDRVAWWGMSDNAEHPDLTSFDGFTIEFYETRTTTSGGFKPTTLIATSSYTLAETGPTATGRISIDDEIEYRHEVALSETVSLLAGVDYFITISIHDIDPAGDAWKWQDSNLYDGWTASFEYARNRWTAFDDVDSAFELMGVPAPSGIAAILIASGVMARRRRG